jgi:hypothetical protein
MRERLHAYTKRTLGAGGSYNDAVSTGIAVFPVLLRFMRYEGFLLLTTDVWILPF